MGKYYGYNCNFCDKITKYEELKKVCVGLYNEELIKNLIERKTRKPTLYSCQKCYKSKNLDLIKTRPKTKKNIKLWYKYHKNI